MAHNSQGPFSRRQLLAQAGGGAAMLALAALLADEGLLLGSAGAAEGAAAADPRLNPLAPKQSHFPAKAKSVIWLFMNGGRSWKASTRTRGSSRPRSGR
jgi:hypothetical protein